MRIPGKRPETSSEGQSVLRQIVLRYRTPMAVLAIVSFGGGLLEAGFLVIITSVAMAMMRDGAEVGPILGRSISVGDALVVGTVVLAVRLALSIVGVRISARLSADVTTDQRHRLSHAYLRTSWAIQQAEPAGRLQELLTSFVQRVNQTITALTQAVTSLLSLIAFLATGIAVDFMSTLAVLVALALVGSVLTPLRRRIRQRSALAARANLEFANAVSELGSLGLEMQTFGVQNRFAERIDELTAQTTATQRKVQMLIGSLSPIYMTLAYAAVLAGVAILTIVGFEDLAVIGAVMLLMLRSLSYGQQVASAAGTLAANAPFLDRIRDTVERYAGSPASSGRAVPAGLTPLEAESVEFSYVPGRPALTGLSFRIDGGDVVGVIGPSGAGKSTLAQILLGLRPTTHGTLRANGTDLAAVDRTWWSRRVAFVAQEALLFTGTVAENIRFFREGVDHATLRRAAAQANILTDVEALPDGFDTHLGERGSQLSGGQRQRLSIARALAGDPELLVLDEPTSALDGKSEALIRETLAQLKGSMTIVIIAHRMSTLEICDRIMVIEGGRMTAFDTPHALHEHSDFYQHAMSVAGITSDR
jgi:ABC-type multidrug transport system fused ATPase/permease subunit